MSEVAAGMGILAFNAQAVEWLLINEKNIIQQINDTKNGVNIW